MTTLGAPSPEAVQDDLVLPIPGRDGVVREYRIPPCTAGELFDLLALDRMYMEIGRHRAHRIANLTGAQAAPIIAPDDPGLQAAIIRLMDAADSTPEAMLMLPLGPIAAAEMERDGVSKKLYMLASSTAMYWHIAGDEAAREIWTTGALPGKPAAPPRRNSTSTGSARTGGAGSRNTGSRRTSKPGSSPRRKTNS